MLLQAVEGVPKIRPGYNPATWMLEVTSSVEENRLGVDFAEIYRKSNLFLYVQYPSILAINFAFERTIPFLI
jgi:hypothetical protein